MSEKILNPFKILGLQPGASQSEVKKAYMTLLQRFHPDKGGNPAHFRLIQRAYKQVNNDYFNYDTTKKVGKVAYNPNEFGVPQIIPQTNFQIDKFNQKFNEHRSEDHNVYQIDPHQVLDRQRGQYQLERSQIDQELGSMKPLITPGKFNSNNFNQVWQEQNNINANSGYDGTVSVYNEPQALGLQVGLQYNGVAHGNELQGGGSITEFSNYNDQHPMSYGVMDDARYSNGGNVKQRYQDMMRDRSNPLNVSSGDSDQKLYDLGAPDKNYRKVSGEPLDSNIIDTHTNSEFNYLNTDTSENTYVEDTPAVHSGNMVIYGGQAVQPSHLTQPSQPSYLSQPSYQSHANIEQMRQVYLQAQIDLMQNLSNLMDQQRRIQSLSSTNQKASIQSPDFLFPGTPVDAKNKKKVLELEKKIREMKKTIAVQDKLLKSLSVTQKT